MTATSTEIETVVDDLTAHEFEICCEHYMVVLGEKVGGECDRPAAWILFKTGHCAYALAHPSILCDLHKDSRIVGNAEVECIGCGTYGPASEMYSRVEPLKGKH